MMRYDLFSTSGDSRGGVGPRNTHFYSQKVYLIPEIHDGRFFTSYTHCIEPPLESSFSGVYLYNATGGYSLVVAAGDGKGDVVPRNNQLYSHKYDFWIDGDNSMSSWSRDY